MFGRQHDDAQVLGHGPPDLGVPLRHGGDEPPQHLRHGLLLQLLAVAAHDLGDEDDCVPPRLAAPALVTELEALGDDVRGAGGGDDAVREQSLCQEVNRDGGGVSDGSQAGQRVGCIFCLELKM